MLAHRRFVAPIVVLAFGACAPSSPAATQDGAAGATGDAGASGVTRDAATSSDGAPDRGGVAPGPIDYSIWQLQLPTGAGTSPMTIASDRLVAGFTNEYFYAAADGGQVFMSPATGITTPGSQHCRTELREMTKQGAPAAWASPGANTLTVSGKVLQVGGGSSGVVTLGQVFNATDSIPLGELEYSTKLGGFQLLYEEAKGNGTTTNLKVTAALSSRYTFQLALSKGVLTVSINGAVAFTKTPSAATAAKAFYFKVGNYDQTTSAGPISTAPYTVVEVYAATVVHE